MFIIDPVLLILADHGIRGGQQELMRPPRIGISETDVIVGARRARRCRGHAQRRCGQQAAHRGEDRARGVVARIPD